MVSIRAAFPSIAALALLLAGPARAEPVALSPAEQAREEKAFGALQRSTKTFQADLRQAVLVRPLFSTLVSTGTIGYQAPDKLEVRFAQPAGQSLRIEDGTVTLTELGKPRRRIPLDSSSGQNAASLLDFFRTDGARWRRDFRVAMARDGDREMVTLTPLPGSPKAGHVEQIVTTLHLPDHEVTAMRISVNPFIRVDYQFTHNRRNGPLDAVLFAP